jgi:hypothetical protein
MNEKIKKLAKQATNPNYDSDNGPMNELNIEKFAELMVKGFIDVVNTEVSDQYDEEYESEDYMDGYEKSIRLACEKIKQHFGIE